MPTGPSGAQTAYYTTFLAPMWKNQCEELASACRDYRRHLLALACLDKARGPGADPVALAQFCRNWQLPLTTPLIGPTSMLRMAAKAASNMPSMLAALRASAMAWASSAVGAAWPSAGIVFDITGAFNWGVKILAATAPLLARIEMRGALLSAFDTAFVPQADQSVVMDIINNARTPQNLHLNVRESQNRLAKKFQEVFDLAKKMDGIREELGLPVDSLT